MRGTNASHDTVVHWIVIAIAVTFAGCASAAPPVPVMGRSTDIAQLVGQWSGEYWSDETGRSGSILFRLEPATDSAFGDILMIPAEAEPHVHPGGVHPLREFIGIRFVRVGPGVVRGQLDPYVDPVCGCRLDTTFEGELRGDEISGTFETRHLESGLIQHGQWRVHRDEGGGRHHVVLRS